MHFYSTTSKTIRYDILSARKHVMKRFLVVFNNRKKHGKFAMQTFHSEGIVFSDGHVFLNTQYLPEKGFESVACMREYLEHWGDYGTLG